MKTIATAKIAKAQGYEYVASVVKSVFRTTYYHVIKLSDLIEVGKWIPANKGQYNNWHGRIGTSHLPEKTILRSDMFNLI